MRTGGLIPERCGYCLTEFPGGSGRDHFTCPSCGKPNGSVLIGPRNTRFIASLPTDHDPPVCPWCGRRMSACQCEDDEVGF